MTTAERRRIIRESAEMNGSFLRDTFDASTDTPTAVATARAVSILITLRSASEHTPVTRAELQAAIDGLLTGARVTTETTRMGAEIYKELP